MDLSPVLQAIGDLREDIGALRADARNVDRRIDEIRDLIFKHVEDDNRVATRVTNLEHDSTRAKTIVGAIGALSGIGASFVVAMLKGWFPHGG